MIKYRKCVPKCCCQRFANAHEFLLRDYSLLATRCKQCQITKNTLNVSIVLAEAYDIEVDAQLEFNRNTKSNF